MGYHMFRDLDQNAPLKAASAVLTGIPWINQSAVLDRDIGKDDWVKDPPFDCDFAKLATEIESRVPTDAPLAYLDLESPMGYPFNARSLACYQEAIGLAKDSRPRTRWGIYSMVHKPLSWRNPGVPWSHWLNSIYPLCDFACPSLYPRSGRWTDDLKERWHIDTIHAELILDDQEAFTRLAFVRPRWASNGGDGKFVPLDWFTNWICSLDRDGIAVCLFMDKKEQEQMFNLFTPYINAVGLLTTELA